MGEEETERLRDLETKGLRDKGTKKEYIHPAPHSRQPKELNIVKYEESFAQY
jgi:hypothetical protein